MIIVLKQKTVSDGILFLIQDGINYLLELKWKNGDRGILYQNTNYTKVNGRYIRAL